MIASLSDIIDTSRDILSFCYQTGMSVEDAGSLVEKQMDGTQPVDLIERAVARAREIRAEAK